MTRSRNISPTHDSSTPHLVKKKNEEALALVKRIHEKWDNHRWTPEERDFQEIRLKEWFDDAYLFVRDRLMHSVGVLCNPEDRDEYLCFEDKYRLMMKHLEDLVANAGPGKLYSVPTKLVSPALS